jgi:hypothetical protein
MNLAQSGRAERTRQVCATSVQPHEPHEGQAKYGAIPLLLLAQSKICQSSCQPWACRIKNIWAGGERIHSPAQIFFMHHTYP